MNGYDEPERTRETVLEFRFVSFYLYTKVPETRTAYFRVIKPNAVIIVI